MEQHKPLTLLQLNKLVAEAIQASLGRKRLWLTAEVSSLSENGGHCYMDLVQKASEGDSQLVARARANVWRHIWRLVRPYFERVTGQRLAPGMQVLLEVTPTLHPQYGYSLNVTNIDPTYSLGELARRRQQILRILDEEGVLNQNKELPLPRLLQRIAIVSAVNAAGYQDFNRQLIDNPHGLAFRTRLFPAILQGERVEPTVIAALDTIAAERDDWDAVVIIRGGGATSDLGGFDTLALAEHVANFPLPIITGIGHERDDTIIDLVAHTRVKTPTAAAEFLITHQKHELDCLLDLTNRIHTLARTILPEQHNRIARLTQLLPSLFAKRNTRERIAINQLLSTAQQAARQRLTVGRNQLDSLNRQTRWATTQWLYKRRSQLALAENTLHNADPQHLLRLGYSITRHNGHALTDITQLQPGDDITTTLANGSIHSTVTSESAS